MIRFNCQDCGQHYKADESFAGEEIECNKCRAWVPVPSASESIPQPISTPSTDANKTQELKMPKLSLPSSSSKTSTEPKETPELKMPKIILPSSAEKTQAKQESEETEVSEIPKVPKLNMPVLNKENTQEKVNDLNLDNPEADCPKCGAALQSASAVICTNCGHNLKLGINAKTAKKVKATGKLGLAIVIGASAALLSGGIWAGIAIYFKMEIGWVACLVGLITGAAVCKVTEERSERIGAIAVALACVGLLTGKMLSAEYLVRDSFQGLPKVFKKMTQFNGRFGKQLQREAFLSTLKQEMQDNGEISDPSKSEELKKNAPEIGEKPSKEYKRALKEASRPNIAKVKKKFATLSAEDKARLQKKQSRLILIFPLQDEMIASGEISRLDKKWKDLAPKNSKEKSSKEYLKASKKYAIQSAENMKKIRMKLAKISDAEAKRLEGKIASSFANKLSYWKKLEMIMSLWDILWFIVAFSIARKLGSGNSIFSRKEI
jgi:hypothetical protein